MGRVRGSFNFMAAIGCLCAFGASPPSTPMPTNDPPAAVALFEKGKQLYKQGDYAQALNALNDALDQGLKDHHVHNWRGKTFFELGRYTQAARAYSMLIQIGLDGGACDT
jgi:tetratricopeptide (TPR) repeat protein